MTEYQCQSCNFRFTAQKKPMRCPYCGKADVVGDIPSAASIMDEVVEKEKDQEDRRQQAIEDRA